MQDSAVNRILIIATVLVIIIVGTLTLLPIEKLRQIFSPLQNNNKTTQPTVTPIPVKQTQILSNDELDKTMKKIGYEPLWKDPADTTGRTLLYRVKDLYYYQIGQFTASNTEGPHQIFAFIGIFEKLEDIPGSADQYIYVIDPHTRKQIGKARLLADTTQKPTILIITSFNLNLNQTENPKPVKIEFVGLLDVWEKYLPYILKSGDSVIVSIKQDEAGRNVKDKNGIFETRELSIHRFAGKDQIFAELGTELKKTKQ